MEAPYSHKLDAEAYQALESLPANPFHRFVRQQSATLEKEREAFETNRHAPLFDYPEAQKLNVARYLEAIHRMEDALPMLCQHNAVVESLYKGKLDELAARARLVEAVQNKDDQSVTTLSEDLFSSPVPTRKELETELARKLSNQTEFFAHEKTITRESFVQMIQRVFDHYDMRAWKVGATKGTSIKIKHGHHGKSPKILIPKEFRVTKKRATSLLAHEIEVHALRTTNGRACPLLLLGRGLDRYIDTEEGLAIYFQQHAHKKLSHRAPGFWDAYTTVLTQDLNFVQVYETIRQARTDVARKANNPEPEAKGRDTAWRLCLRAYRGIHNTGTAGVGYRRDHIYRSGLTRVNAALEQHSTPLLDTLFVGNVGLQHVAQVKELGLRPAKQPDLIAADVVESMT